MKTDEILDKKQLRMIFIKLLESKGVWNIFFQEVNNPRHGQYPHKGDINKLFEMDPADWMDSAFAWEDAPNGHGFWMTLDEEWVNIVELNVKD